MDTIDKIKALQAKAGIEADGIVNSTIWLNIYYLLFRSIPYDINTRSIIKAIEKKIGVRVDGYPWHKVWDVLYDQLVVNDNITELAIDNDNRQILNTMPKEVVPFVKELICLAAKHGINVKIANDSNAKVKEDKSEYVLSIAKEEPTIYNFGLGFNVTILPTPTIENTEEELTLYAKVAKLGESIGLTCVNGKNKITDVANFILRPAWAVRMKENEMLQELERRRREDVNLLSIL